MMGLELAKAYIRIQADSSELGAGLDQAKGQTESAISSIQTTASGITAALGMMAGAFLQLGMQSSISFEQTQIAFDTMLGSADETKRTLADLTDFAAKTPFEMPEILGAARGLIQFGERGEQLMDTLKMLGDAAAGTSQPFGEVALIFNQVRGAGRLMGQDLMQLSQRGILTLKDLADYLGKSVAEIDAMKSKGQISFDIMREALAKLSQEGGRYYNLMEKQSTSLGGLISTLKDGYNILAQTMAGPVATAVKPMLSFGIKLLDVFGGLARTVPQAAAGALLAASAFGIMSGGLLAVTIAAQLLNITLAQAFMTAGLAAGIMTIAVGIGFLTGYLTDANIATSDVVRNISRLVAGIGGFYLGMKLATNATLIYTTVTKAATSATVFFQSILGGPIAWAKIAAGIAAAAGAVLLVERAYTAATSKASQHATTEQSVAEAIDQTSNAVKAATQAVNGMTSAVSDQDEAYVSLIKTLAEWRGVAAESPTPPNPPTISKPEQTTQEQAQARREAPGGIGGMFGDIGGVFASMTGMSEAADRMGQSLGDVAQEVGEIAGLPKTLDDSAGMFDVLRQRGIDAASPLTSLLGDMTTTVGSLGESINGAMQEFKTQNVTALADAFKQLEKDAIKLKAGLTTPLEEYGQQVEKIKTLLSVGLLTPAEAIRAAARAMEDLDKASGGPAAKLKEMEDRADALTQGLTDAEIEAERYGQLEGANIEAFRQAQKDIGIGEIFASINTEMDAAMASLNGMTPAMAQLYDLGASMSELNWFAEQEESLKAIRKELAIVSKEAGERLTQALKTPVENSEEQVRILRENFRSGWIDEETYRRGLVAEQRKLTPELAPRGFMELGGLSDAITQSQLGLEDMLDPAKTSAEEAQKHTALLNDISTELKKVKPGGLT